MSFTFKSKKLLRWITGLSAGLLVSVVLFWNIVGDVWTRLDFQSLDLIFKYAVKLKQTAPASPRIVYLTINDGTYQAFGKNTLDRAYLAKINDVLAEVGPQAVAYDIIFAHPSDPAADQQFAAALAKPGRVYLPFGLEPSEYRRSFQWEAGNAYERLKTTDLKQPVEKGTAKPLYALRAFMQFDLFAAAAYGSGHITALPDPDGVFRHQLLLLKLDAGYVPTLSLAMFLDDAGVSFNDVLVDWGREIRIPAAKSQHLQHDVVIPIDARGRAFIPFTQAWGKDFANITAQDVLQRFADVALQGNVEEFFSGKFVFVGDVAQGIADLGQTPLEANAPLIALHTALLNGLLTNTFYRPWSSGQALLLLCGLAVVLTIGSLPKQLWPLYAAGGASIIGLGALTWFEFIHFRLFPIVTVGGSFLFLLGGLVIGLQVAIAREQAFIRGAFARYVPETVVKELLNHPEKLTLGGEKRTLSVLFSDLQGFTTISEQLAPEELVRLLNEYLTEMTTIILNAGGIIDKYQGDAIMAEFGAPLPLPDHADRAVAAALQMQRRLTDLRQQWAARNLPELRCRIGINTGEVVVGNMGSQQVFDYTVIGDDVNLASRLEGANKHYHTFLMISEATYQALTPGRFHARVLDVIKVKGKTTAVKVFEVYGKTTDVIAPEALAYYQTYQTAFEAYLARDFTLAIEKFAGALHLRSNDPASKWLISRIVALNPAELPAAWDGSVALDSK